MTVKTRHFVSVAAFVAGVALSIAAGVWAQAGYPSRPRFLSFGVNSTAPTTNGGTQVGGSPRLPMNGVTADWQWVGSNAFDMRQRYAAGAGGPDLGFYHSRSATLGTHTILQDGDELGSVSFMASDGTSTPVKTARVIAKVDGVVGGATDLPSRLEFYTTPDGSSSLRLAATIGQSGALTVSDGPVIANLNGAVGTSQFRLSDDGATGVVLGLALGAGSCLTGDVAGDFCVYTGADRTMRFNMNNGGGSTFALTSSTVAYGGVDMTPVSGTFTASYDDACTTTPTQTWDYQRVGNQVTLSMRAAPAACTGDSFSFGTTGAPVPAALRPSGTSSGAIQGAFCNNFVDNAAGASAWVQVTEAGNISFVRATVSGSNLTTNTWTNAGNRQPGRDCQVSYMLGNP